MQNSLAKLAAPRGVEILRRQRVIDLIDRALKSGMCWVAAPAGYGKTTAVVDYLRSGGWPYVWFRVDESDHDIARFFHYLAQSLATQKVTAAMPVFEEAYAEQPREFARLFFRAYFAELRPETVIVLDDLHYADTVGIREVLSVMLHELPATLRCICLSRTLPRDELGDQASTGSIGLIGHSSLEFTESEALDLLAQRLKRPAESIDIAPARGWALGLVLLTEQRPLFATFRADDERAGHGALFDLLGRQLFESLSEADQDMLLKLNLLPEISAELADAVAGSHDAGKLLERLYNRQLLTTRAEANVNQFHLHDLLRDFLHDRLVHRFSLDEQADLRRRTAVILREAGRFDEAISLSLQATAWDLARDLMLARAESVLGEGERATFISWCSKLPSGEMNAWLFYWLGVAHMPDDAAAEHWLSKAWTLFEQAGDRGGQCLAVSRAVLVKTNSWRTYRDMSAWTRRAIAIIEQGLPDMSAKENLIVRTGMVRALDFADEYQSDGPATQILVAQLLDQLARGSGAEPSGLRVSASESLIEHAISAAQPDLFANAVDSVVEDLGDPNLSSSILGSWLVVFGAARGRYFRYSRRGFPYSTAEDALRAAIAIGERELFRNVEFGALYHLQMLMKLRNDFSEFSKLVDRLAEIADSRFTTQVAVVADCHAAMHARQGDFVEAYRDCDRFMAAIEAANEPIIERWPHYITKFQVFLANRKPGEAITLLTELLPHLDGGTLRRTELCILAAEALEAKWQSDVVYEDRLRLFLNRVHIENWPSILVNMPELLAEMLADALDREIAVDYCRSLIHERRLVAPTRRPARWPWAFRVCVLGGFRLERDDRSVEFGAKPPTRALDILRALALSRDGTCSIESLQDWLWPDLDGDNAKAALEQALHRLRRFLGRPDLVLQREGKIRLAADLVWVDLAEWESRLKSVLRPATKDEAVARELARLFSDFPGPPLLNERPAGWQVPVMERVRNAFVDLAVRFGKQLSRAEPASAEAVYLRALEFYPDSARLYEGLIATRLQQSDIPAAVADYARYQRTVRATGDGDISVAIRTLIEPYLRTASPRDNNA